ncbi:MAG: 3'-5' exonuclease [Gemmatimonadales bacterium]|nr:MAG: 3'-5' exonuclease [Gemmatimonadales bacterium]
MTEGGGGGSLLESAGAALARAPLHTLDLARQVLKLKGGNPSAASAAVFALLGTDPRFTVDSQGIWRLTEGAAPPGTPLRELEFAVVDVETTGGGYGRGHRVTEVAVVPVSRGRIGEAYRTLVHPGRSIPPRIEALTGISDAMVRGAPPFDVIADDLRDELEGRIFVAHNVSFDWGFIREELLAARGDVPEVERLCTVKMGRRLVPGLRSYALDALTRHFEISIHDRHRAFGDALATARLLLLLIERAETEGVGDLEGLHHYLSVRQAPRRRRG